MGLLYVQLQPRKVVAVSLADYVSREMCVKLGEELNYKTGMPGKYSQCCESSNCCSLSEMG